MKRRIGGVVENLQAEPQRTQRRRRARSKSVRGLGNAFLRSHGMENGRDDIFIPNRRVDHHVVQRPGRPVGAEIMLYEENSFAVHGVDKIFGVVLTLAHTSLLAARTGRRETRLDGHARSMELHGRR